MSEGQTFRATVLTLFPEMLSALTEWGVTGRAVDEGRFQLSTVNPRDFAQDRHGSVDDRPYGGGPGMVMQAPVMAAALASALSDEALADSRPRVIAMGPAGRVLDDALVRELALEPALVLIAGRYEGIDERFLQAHVDEEVSVGDYVVSGGELPAMMLLDAVVRHRPGVLGHVDSAEEDSFAQGLLDCPHYTRPESYAGRQGPEVLLSGNHGEIAKWRYRQSLLRTRDRRPDLLAKANLGSEDKALLYGSGEESK